MTFSSRSIADDFASAHQTWVTAGHELSPSVPVYFLGTQHRDDVPAETMRRRASRNQTVLETAIRILSQCETGRELLQIASAANFKIQFDQACMQKEMAQGMCDIPSRRIILRGHDDPLKLAVLLAHECAHARQAVQSPAIMPDNRLHPLAFIKNSFAIEADAYAHQMQVALELAYLDPSGRQRVYTDKLLKSMRRDYPWLTRAAENNIRSYDDIASGYTASHVFRAFYTDRALREAYEENAMRWMTDKISTAASPVSPKLFSADMTSVDILNSLSCRHRAYVVQHQPAINLDDIAYSGVSLRTAEKVKALYDLRLPFHTQPIPKILAEVPRIVFDPAARRGKQIKHGRFRK